MKKFWDAFYSKSLDQIPWQNTQADWFKELVDSGRIVGKTALDLGCGTGKKSIYLVKEGSFGKVIGIDIAHKAVEIAQTNAKDAGVEDICDFIQHDASDLGFMGNKTFDFILDWANLHGMPKETRQRYVDGIAHHSHSGTLFLVRAFSSDKNDDYFLETVGGLEKNIYLFSKADILALFPEFELIDEHKSQPKTKNDYFFIELLMRKK